MEIFLFLAEWPRARDQRASKKMADRAELFKSWLTLTLR